MRNYLVAIGAALSLVAGVFGLAGLESLRAQSAGQLEPGVNRPGGDYTSFDLEAGDPRICQSACARDSRCRAFTYTVPGFQGRGARCWLKNSVPPPQANNCCISGVNAVASRGDLEEDINRMGYDYRRFEVGNDPYVCRNACIADGNCRSFTFVKPGAQVASAVCYLKNATPGATPNGCCVSGVVRAGAPPPPPGGGGGGYGVSGTWNLTSNCGFTNPAWSAQVNLNQAPNGALSASTSNDSLNTAQVSAGTGDAWGSTLPSRVQGAQFSLLLKPRGWLSVLELTGQISNGPRIDGRVHHHTDSPANDECNFTMTR